MHSGLFSVVSTWPDGLQSVVHVPVLPGVLSILGGAGRVGGAVGEEQEGLPDPLRQGHPSPDHSHLQDHDNVGLLFEGVHTLDQLGVVQAVHDADLLPDVLFLLGRIRLEEFPCPDFSSFLFYKSKDLSKFPTVNERKREI